MDSIERVIVFATALQVLATAGGVAMLTVFQKGTGIDRVVVDSDMSMLRWLESRRDRKLSGRTGPVIFDSAPAGGTRPGATGASANGDGPATAREAMVKVARSRDYFRVEGRFPKTEQVPGLPGWIKREPGVRYLRPRRVPSTLVRRYRAVDKAVELMKEPRGQFLQGPMGTTFRVDDIPERSYLKDPVGLEPGDEIISVNGVKIEGVGITAAKAIYNQIKDADRFAVKILRRGRIQVLSFTVKR